ncbi:MAG: carbohydrate-binding family 9-like protein [Allomuricauda sp.]
MTNSPKHVYNVKFKARKKITDGTWDNVEVLDDFKQPWNDRPLQKTRFRAFHDGEWLYLRYDVDDTSIVTYVRNNDKIEVAYSDRVEIFFRKDEAMERYYCLEIDPNGRVLDYCASFYRDFDYGWSWPKEQLYANASITEEGYRVDLRIGLKSLSNIGVLLNGELSSGIFRADCKNRGPTFQKTSDFHWITWVDPKTQEPDFHVPSSFGKLKLLDLYKR